MRVLLINEKDIPALLDQLKLASFLIKERPTQFVRPAEPSPHSKPVEVEVVKNLHAAVVEDIHRRFHYVVTCWFQEQGASAVRGVD